MKETGAASGIELDRFLPLRLLLQALQLAIGARALVLSTLGLWLTIIGWMLCGQFFGIPNDEPLNMAESAWPWQNGALASPYNWVPVGFWLSVQTLLSAWARLSLPFTLALDPNLSS